jgi:adenine-specific DNA-methyltransferase
MVQLPEPCVPGTEAHTAGYKTIAEIGRDRIRRYLSLKKDTTPECQSLELNNDGDRGFKAFSLTSSNFQLWRGEALTAQKDKHLEEQIELHIDHLLPSSDAEDILYELLLKAGFPLSTKVNRMTLAGKQVFSIQDAALLICLEKEITSELIDALAEANPLQVICLDKGFKNNDQLKANAVQTFKARAEAEESEIVFKTV